jgi:hypothetical protein
MGHKLSTMHEQSSGSAALPNACQQCRAEALPSIKPRQLSGERCIQIAGQRGRGGWSAGLLLLHLGCWQIDGEDPKQAISSIASGDALTFDHSQD